MVPVKIECECGQRYAFDVEPVDGRMPGSIACPACGADGTPAANQSITRHFATAVPITPTIRMISPAPAQVAPATPAAATVALFPTAPIPPVTPAAAPVAAAAPASIQPMRLSVSATTAARPAPPPSTSRPDPRLGLVGKEQAEHEARAKAMWGDPRNTLRVI
jgi:hypothetical protein